MNILQAMDDPNLFAPHFKGSSWKPWKAFLAALFGLPSDEASVALFRHHTGRAMPATEEFREAALICGRRGGKSRVLGLIAVYLAVFRSYGDLLAPGEAPTIAVIAADRKQARAVMRFVTGLFDHVDLLKPMVESRTTESITLKSGLVIEVFAASYRNTRGYSLVAVIADEIAFWRSEETSANPADEILRAVRPGLSNLNGMLLLASSPHDQRGPLYSAFRRYYGQDDARVLVWKGTTAEMNPTISAELIARAYAEDPVNAAAEFGAEFRSDIAAFVSREAVEGCIVPGRLELPPLSSLRYVAFVDPSGGSADSMTMAIAHEDGDHAVLDCVREVKPPFSPKGVVSDFAATLKTYRVSRVTGDRYAGEWPREVFRDHGITYDTSEKTKVDIYRDTLPLLNSGRLELLDLPRLVSQLCGLERRTARGGRDSIDHAPGGHDDLANSVAGVLLLAKVQRPLRISAEALERARNFNNPSASPTSYAIF